MQRSKDDNSFKSLIKGTSIFGGVQVVQILVNLVRAKFVALFLGPEGMGINTLYATSTSFIQQFASLGINLSIVKEIAADKNEEAKLDNTIHVSLKLILLTSILGLLVCCIGAPILSKLTFDDYSHTVSYLLLGIMMFFTLASAGLASILQGLHVVKILSKATLVGCTVGLLIGVPLYYFFGVDGIVPAMIVLALATFIFYIIGIKKTLRVSWTPVNLKDNKAQVKRIFKLGFTLVMSSLIGSSLLYLLNIIIREYGSYDAVGYFQAANSITNQYVGLIFAAMSLDYFPRLSAISKNNVEMSELVNRQLVITSTVITPLICLLITTTPLVIWLLLTDAFYCTIDLIRWLSFGLFFRAICYPVSYITFAKGNEKRFFLLEGILGNVLYYGITIIMFLKFGLVGLGISLTIVYFLLFIIQLLMNNMWYEYKITRPVVKLLLVYGTIALICFSASFIQHSVSSYAIMSAVSLIAIIYSTNIIRKNLKQGNAES